MNLQLMQASVEGFEPQNLRPKIQNLQKELNKFRYPSKDSDKMLLSDPMEEVFAVLTTCAKSSSNSELTRKDMAKCLDATTLYDAMAIIFKKLVKDEAEYKAYDGVRRNIAVLCSIQATFEWLEECKTSDSVPFIDCNACRMSLAQPFCSRKALHDTTNEIARKFTLAYATSTST